MFNLAFLSILSYLGKAGECDGLTRCTFQSEEVTISGTTFNGLSAISDGGAIYIDSCEVSISQTQFTSCKSDKSGGAIYCQQTASHTFTIIDCTFNKCSAFDGGALFYKQTEACSDEISNCIFQECKAKGIGGGALFQSNGGSVIDCTFVSCEAEFNGGSLVYWNVASQSESGIVQRCSFESVLSLNNPNEFYIATRQATVKPLKIADCCFFAQANWENNPGCFLIAAGSDIEFEGTNYLGGTEDSIVWPFSGKVETSSITYNAQSCPAERPTRLPTPPSSQPTSKPSSQPSSQPSSKPSISTSSSSSSSSSTTSYTSNIPTSPSTIQSPTTPNNQDGGYKSEIDDIKEQTKKLKLISIIFIASICTLMVVICPILIFFIIKTVRNGVKKETLSLHEPLT